MYTKRVLKNHNREQNPFWISTVVSNSLLFIGALLLVSSLLYMLFNLNKSDLLIVLLVPLVVLGISLMVVSQIFHSKRTKLKHSSGHPNMKNHKI